MKAHKNIVLLSLLTLSSAAAVMAQDATSDNDPLQDLLSNRETMIQTASDFDATVLRMQQTLSEYTNRIQVLQAQVTDQQEALARMNQTRSAEAEKKIEYAEKLKRLQQLFTKQRDELEESKVRIYELQKEMDEKELALKEAEFVQGSIMDLQARVEEQQAVITDLKDQIGSLELQLAEERAARAEAEARKSAANRVPQAAALQKRIATMEQQILKLREQRQQEAWEKAVLQESLTKLRVDMETEIAPTMTDDRPAMARIHDAVPLDDIPPPRPVANQADISEVEPPPPSIPPAELVVLANKKLRAGQTSEAKSLFESALAVNPKLSGARLGLASCYYAQRNFESAKDLIDALLYDEPRNALALGLRGLIAYTEQDLETARDALDLALQINGKDAQLRNYYGMVLFAQGDIDGAARQFRQSIELDKTRPEAQLNLALLLATTEPMDIEESRRYYESALELGGAKNKRLEAILYP